MTPGDLIRVAMLDAFYHQLGIRTKRTMGWLVKAETAEGIALDLMFPELPFGGYDEDEE